MSWAELGEWWLREVRADPAYEEEVTPLLLDVLEPAPEAAYLDVGCGDGRIMGLVGRLGARTVGVDLNRRLLEVARRHGPVVAAELPDLGWLADEALDGAYVCLVLEHVADHRRLFAELGRVVRPGGVLAVVVNHPVFTAPGAAPVEEPDGEVLWRPGRYFSEGWTDELVDGSTVRFHHRTLGELLTAAADAGWRLRRLLEEGVGEAQIVRHPPYGRQRHIPRLLAARWTRG